MKSIFYFIVLLYMPLFSFSQSIEGNVYGQSSGGEKEPLSGANVYWCHILQGTVTDSTGYFSIRVPADSSHRLVISFIGYLNDTLTIEANTQLPDIILKSEVELAAAEVSARSMSTQISTLKPVNMETIGQTELKKAACCNLSESFESNASVDVVIADAVSGARAIQMLGLSGVYTQLLSENVPMTRGLSANYGLQYIPGTWVQSIQITKGIGSVVNGYESMGGQINIEFLKPEDKKTEKIYLNFYENSMGRSELNFHLNKKFSDKISTLLFTHASGVFMRGDFNKDGFMSYPLSKQLNMMNRWKINGKRTQQIISVRGLYDYRQGGQMNYNPETDKDTTIHWGSEIRAKIIEGYFKNGFLFPQSATRSLGVILSAKHHDQDSYFGLRNYTATQNSAYANLIYSDVFGNTNHAYRTGMSYVFDHFNEKYLDSAFSTQVNVPGTFFEYTYSHLENFTLLLGVREDYHNLYGWKFTPRLHLRYAPTESITLRASGGSGFRNPHVIMENAATLVSSRKLVMHGNLNAEQSWNTGASATIQFKFLKRDAMLNADYYYTYFVNQAVIDLDQDVHEVNIYNLNGLSYSHSAQIDLDLEWFKGFSTKMAYKHYVVKTQYMKGVLDKPFIPKDRVMLNVSYQTRNKKWKFDWINNWYGPSRIPDTQQLPAEDRMPDHSPGYLIMHFQITKQFRHFEWYLGGENLLNNIQRKVIIGANDPFGANFDASLIWGSLSGRVVYSGIRILIK